VLPVEQVLNSVLNISLVIAIFIFFAVFFQFLLINGLLPLWLGVALAVFSGIFLFPAVVILSPMRG
jgi:ABC-type multidrug transport system permease subunit